MILASLATSAAAQGAPPEPEPAALQSDAAAALQSLDSQLEILRRTEQMLVDRKSVRQDELRARARAAYKLLRGGTAPMWVDEDSRALLARQRAEARRALAREHAELAILDEELEVVARARERIERERQTALSLSAPAPGSLHLPVAFSRVIERFGSYRHDASRARLSRRGVTLSSRPGRNVRAVAPGTVRFAGPVRGLGHTVIVDHGDFWSLLGELTPGQAVAGSVVERGDILGESIGERVYLEIRLTAVAGGFPVDPAPLLDWNP